MGQGGRQEQKGTDYHSVRVLVLYFVSSLRNAVIPLVSVDSGCVCGHPHFHFML